LQQEGRQACPVASFSAPDRLLALRVLFVYLRATVMAMMAVISNYLLEELPMLTAPGGLLQLPPVLAGLAVMCDSKQDPVPQAPVAMYTYVPAVGLKLVEMYKSRPELDLVRCCCRVAPELAMSAWPAAAAAVSLSC
jgi:hypothetical protein